MIDSAADLELITHILCCSWAMCFSAAASSENDHGNMNLASNTASVSSTLPSRASRNEPACAGSKHLHIFALPLVHESRELLKVQRRKVLGEDGDDVLDTALMRGEHLKRIADEEQVALDNSVRVERSRCADRSRWGKRKSGLSSLTLRPQ